MAPVKDTGYAWIVCASSFIAQVGHGGLIYSMGIFYIMFKNGLDASDSALSLITSLNYSICFLICPVVGILTERFGERILGLVGAGFIVVGLVCSSFSTEVYQLYISYSVITGIGMGMVYNPSMSILAQYFNKYSKVATALAVCGTGVGAFIFPPVIRILENHFGWRGAILMVAGICAHDAVACCFYRRINQKGDSNSRGEGIDDAIDVPHKNIIYIGDTNRDIENKKTTLFVSNDKPLPLPANGSTETKVINEANMNDTLLKPEEENQKRTRASNDSSTSKSFITIKRTLVLFRIIRFVCLCIHSLVVFFPTVLVYTHLGSYYLTLGFSGKTVVLMYMAMGITSMLSRILLGVIAEISKVNSSLVILLSSVIGGIFTIILPYSHNKEFMFAYSIIFVMSLTPYNVLCFPSMAEAVGSHHAATAYGIICFFCVPGTAFGPPLAAWIYETTHVYSSSFLLAGALLMLSGLIMIPALLEGYSKRHTRDNISRNTERHL